MTAEAEIVAFLNDRIAEDERRAERASQSPWRVTGGLQEENRSTYLITCRSDPHTVAEIPDYGFGAKESFVHIVAWQPARVLAECAAKRKIIRLHTIMTRPQTSLVTDDTGSAVAIRETGLTEYSCQACDDTYNDRSWHLEPGCQTLRFLAAPLADHPGYQESWRP